MATSNNSFEMTPPILNKEYNYSNRKYNLSAWEAFTLL